MKIEVGKLQAARLEFKARKAMVLKQYITKKKGKSISKWGQMYYGMGQNGQVGNQIGARWIALGNRIYELTINLSQIEKHTMRQNWLLRHGEQNLHALDDKKLHHSSELGQLPRESQKLSFLININDFLLWKADIIGTILDSIAFHIIPKGIIGSGRFLEKLLLKYDALLLEFQEEQLVVEVQGHALICCL
jgi:hypothetical protein